MLKCSRERWVWALRRLGHDSETVRFPATLLMFRTRATFVPAPRTAAIRRGSRRPLRRDRAPDESTAPCEMRRRRRVLVRSLVVHRSTARPLQDVKDMTLRIDTVRDGGRVAVRLIGRLRGENLGDLERQLAEADRPTVLELDEVNLIDVDAVYFLRDVE